MRKLYEALIVFLALLGTLFLPKPVVAQVEPTCTIAAVSEYGNPFAWTFFIDWEGTTSQPGLSSDLKYYRGIALPLSETNSISVTATADFLDLGITYTANVHLDGAIRCSTEFSVPEDAYMAPPECQLDALPTDKSNVKAFRMQWKNNFVAHGQLFRWFSRYAGPTLYYGEDAIKTYLGGLQSKQEGETMHFAFDDDVMIESIAYPRAGTYLAYFDIEQPGGISIRCEEEVVIPQFTQYMSALYKN